MGMFSGIKGSRVVMEWIVHSSNPTGSWLRAWEWSQITEDAMDWTIGLLTGQGKARQGKRQL